MVKKLTVDVKKSLGYQANGRLKPAEKEEHAHLKIKKFICPDCQKEIDAEKTEFGEIKACPACGTVMLQQY
jgi:NAD-dependent SIR2 family protein deacetylase